MRTGNVSRRRGHCFFLVLFSLLCLLNACADGTAASQRSVAAGTRGAALPVSTASTGSQPDEGVAATIPVGARPDILVGGGNAKLLTFVGADTENISTTTYALPYQKEGEKVHIKFGHAVDQALVIQIPRRANLTVTLTEGNVSVKSVQGAVNITLTSGTIDLKDFTPQGADVIQTESGIINVTFAKDASCRLEAQTNFGAIVSSYATIQETRSGEQAKASGNIRDGSGASVKLTVTNGSISIGPA